MNLDLRIEKALQQRENEGLLRKLGAEQHKIDFVSNDYLGLARSQHLAEYIQAEAHKLPFQHNGSSGSRLLSGNSALTEQLEAQLARIFQSEKALVLNSGYVANMSVLSSLPQRGDTILYDELAHACIKDGARLSLADRFSFRHNDLADLRNKLMKSKGHTFIAVESIYSMDGDQCPLPELVSLAEEFNASIILDEAHSTGVVGNNGSGLSVSLNLHHKIAIRVYTFGKAMGVHGACVAANTNIINYLINFARPFIYTTALSPHSILSIKCAFDFLDKEIQRQSQLRSRINLFLQHLQGSPHRKIESDSAIQSIVIPGNASARAFASQLQAAGFDCRPILSPTVKEGNERIRICLHSFNTDNEIINLTQTLKTSLSQA